ncbi:MAG: hypothetical protein AMXMBFR53_07860 [Gemmatimonadota bacterium]
MGVDREAFYDPERVAILPMGFCFPGTGAHGDLPPRAECARAWREGLLAHLPDVGLTLALGRYAQAWHLGDDGVGVTERVRRWKEGWPAVLALPHPSPRNNRWLRANPWFEADVLPALRVRVAELIRTPAPP